MGCYDSLRVAIPCLHPTRSSQDDGALAVKKRARSAEDSFEHVTPKHNADLLTVQSVGVNALPKEGTRNSPTT